MSLTILYSMVILPDYKKAKPYYWRDEIDTKNITCCIGII